MKLALRFIVACSLLVAVNAFGATARDLLFSPSPSMRMVGAKILLGQYVPPPRAEGDKLVARLELGMSESEVNRFLVSAGATNESMGTIRDETVKTYRVDDMWVVRCWFTNAVATNAVITNAVTRRVITNSVAKKSEGGLAEARLLEQMNQAYVDPPSDYTGAWLTYWINGQVSYERNFLNGQLNGVTTGFYPDGRKSIVISYRNGVPDGDDVGFFPSGVVQYEGHYKAGQEVGHWIWYRDDGSIETEKDYDAKGK